MISLRSVIHETSLYGQSSCPKVSERTPPKNERENMIFFFPSLSGHSDDATSSRIWGLWVISWGEFVEKKVASSRYINILFFIFFIFYNKLIVEEEEEFFTKSNYAEFAKADSQYVVNALNIWTPTEIRSDKIK